METSGIGFDKLPQKAKKAILASFPQEQREHLRRVCKSWNQFIIEEFPVQILIDNSNFERLFRCSRANKATLSYLATEYSGEIAFSKNLRSLVSVGKVLTSNVKRILLACNNLESLCFTSLQQVVGVDEEEQIILPKVSEIEIKVRGDQETFTSDETIILNLLKKVQFGCLEKIVISVKTALEWLAEEIHVNEEPSVTSQDPTLAGWGSGISGTTTLYSFNLNDDSSGPISMQMHPSFVTRFESPGPDVAPMMLDGSTSVQTEASQGFMSVISAPTLEHREARPFPSGPSPTPDVGQSTNSQNTQTNGTSLRHVANTRSIALGAESDSVSGDDMAYYQPGMSQFDVIARFFNARIHAQIQESGSNLEAILSDPRSRAEFIRGFDYRRPDRSTLQEPPPLLELIRNNAKTVKTLIVKAKPEFMCFGSACAQLDVRAIQLKEIEYSFGRSQLCVEYPLLEAQCQLVKVTVQIFDDLWDSLMTAVQQSSRTLKEMDLRVLSLSHDPLDLGNLSICSSLTLLKIFHYYEKRSLGTLPTSITRLILNGPLSVSEMETLAFRLKNLQELTIIANLQGGRVDLRLFKKLVSMPKISKVIFIQCQVDVEDIEEYSAEHETNVTVKVFGPTRIPDGDIFGALIQFVVINIAEPLPIST